MIGIGNSDWVRLTYSVVWIVNAIVDLWSPMQLSTKERLGLKYGRVLTFKYLVEGD